MASQQEEEERAPAPPPTPLAAAGAAAAPDEAAPTTTTIIAVEEAPSPAQTEQRQLQIALDSLTSVLQQQEKQHSLSTEEIRLALACSEACAQLADRATLSLLQLTDAEEKLRIAPRSLWQPSGVLEAVSKEVCPAGVSAFSRGLKAPAVLLLAC